VVESGIVLLKYWLEVSPEEQTNRLTARIDDKRKIWKLSQMDLDSYARWDDYTRARDDMFEATDTAWAPWFIARSDNKRQARLNIIAHLLSTGIVWSEKCQIAERHPVRASMHAKPQASWRSFKLEQDRQTRERL
jgi:polyphosphate kinase